jgi:phosphatidylserine decarboxylase
MGALPLRSLSQLWGYLNGLVLPVWFRPFGFKLYAKIFGCNLDEMAEQDLTKYDSLGEFFYRELKEGVRAVADCPMVSPRFDKTPVDPLMIRCPRPTDECCTLVKSEASRSNKSRESPTP